MNVLNDGWDAFQRDLIAPGAPPEAILWLRRAYFVGALTVMRELRDMGGAEGDAHLKCCALRLQLMEEECHQFLREAVEGES